jgi:hypothetical protein
MTTTAVKAPAAGPILAIDLGKYKCVACVYHAADRYTFHAIETSRSEVERLIHRTRPAVVVIEACSLAGWVHDLCGQLGVPCRMANTGAEAWKYKHAKRKTDRDDALRLAQLYALGKLPEVVVPAKATRAPCTHVSGEFGSLAPRVGRWPTGCFPRPQSPQNDTISHPLGLFGNFLNCRVIIELPAGSCAAPMVRGGDEAAQFVGPSTCRGGDPTTTAASGQTASRGKSTWAVGWMRNSSRGLSKSTGKSGSSGACAVTWPARRPRHSMPN